MRCFCDMFWFSHGLFLMVSDGFYGDTPIYSGKLWNISENVADKPFDFGFTIFGQTHLYIVWE